MTDLFGGTPIQSDAENCDETQCGNFNRRKSADADSVHIGSRKQHTGSADSGLYGNGKKRNFKPE